jgi:5-methylcytosine-specific restriction endonuclease McrA
VSDLLALQAQRQEPHLSQAETALLLQINEGISAETQQRFDELVGKRQSLSVEHILARTKGGTTTSDNLALACQGCNNHKYDKMEARSAGGTLLGR